MSNRTKELASCKRALQRHCPSAKPCLTRIRAGRIVMFKFRMGMTVSVPTDFFASGRARLVGVEMAPENKHLRKYGDGYVYTLVEESPAEPLVGLAKMRADENPAYVSEEQIAAWNPK